MDFLDILLERVIRSKLNKKAEWVKAYLGYVWFGPQLEKILRLSFETQYYALFFVSFPN